VLPGKLRLLLQSLPKKVKEKLLKEKKKQLKMPKSLKL